MSTTPTTRVNPLTAFREVSLATKEVYVKNTMDFALMRAKLGVPDITEQELVWFEEYYRPIVEAVYPRFNNLPDISGVLATLILASRDFLDPELKKTIRARIKAGLLERAPAGLHVL